MKITVTLVMLFIALWLALDLARTGNARIRGAASDAQVAALTRVLQLTLWIKFVLALASLAGVVVVQVYP